MSTSKLGLRNCSRHRSSDCGWEKRSAEGCLVVMRPAGGDGLRALVGHGLTPLRSALSSARCCRRTSLPRDDTVVATVNTQCFVPPQRRVPLRIDAIRPCDGGGQTPLRAVRSDPLRSGPSSSDFVDVLRYVSWHAAWLPNQAHGPQSATTRRPRWRGPRPPVCAVAAGDKTA